MWMQVVLLFLTNVVYSYAYIDCGAYVCTGLGAYCCFDDECCYTQVYSFWWFWLIWVGVFTCCGACGYCCRRRYVERRQVRDGYIIVPPPQQPIYTGQAPAYGAAGAAPTYGVVAPQGAAHLPTAPVRPPAYMEKPPDYNNPPQNVAGN